jgi:hypothetical protein
MQYTQFEEEQDQLPKNMGGPIALLLVALLVYGLISFDVIELPGHIGFGFVAMLAVYFLTMIDIRFGMVCLIFAIGLSPEIKWGAATNLRLEDFLMPGLLIAWLTRAVGRREEFASTTLKGPIIATLLLAVTSALFGVAGGTVVLERSFFHVGKTFMYYLILVLVMNNTRSERDAYIYIITMVVVSVAAAIHGYAMFATEGKGKISGPFGESANVLGGYLIFHMALIIGLIFGVNRNIHKLVLAVCFLIIFKAFLHTMSRTSYVALLLGLAVFGIMKRRTLLLAMFVFLIILPAIIPTEVTQRAATILDIFGDKPPSSWSARVVGWQMYGKSLFTHPLLGKGVGSITLAQVDNEYMKVLIETGLLGTLVFFWLLISMGKLSLVTFEKAKNVPLLSAFCLGYLGALLTLAVHGLGATSFTTIRTMEPLMVATGLLVAISNNYEKWHAMKPKEETQTPTALFEPRPLYPRRALHRQV